MAAYQADVLQSCFQEAAKAAGPALAHCVEAAAAALQDAELKSMKVAERDELASAWRLLLANKAAWSARYQASLLDAFDSNAEAARTQARIQHLPKSDPVAASVPARHAGRLGVQAFSLVEDADVTQAIESSRLLQQLSPQLEQSLAELDSLISSALGLDNVRPELNPVRPEIFASVLQDIMMASEHADAALARHWIRHLAAPLAREMRRIYEHMVHLLELAHVKAAHYRVLQAPAGATGGRSDASNRSEGGGRAAGEGPDGTGGAGGTAGAGPGRQPSQYADLSNYEIHDELFQDFLFHGGSQAQQGLAPSYYATIEEELTSLKAAPDSSPSPLHDTAPEEEAGYRAMPAVDRPQRLVDVSTPLSPQVWGAYGRSRERAIVRTQLKKEATKVGQVLGLEVVRKLVNQVAQDPRLLVPVREAIVALEPSLLRLAMVDPRFFSDERHPGRRLMERVAQRSFKYNDEYSGEFAGFFSAITHGFNQLNALAIDDARPFAAALARLEGAWDLQDQAEFESRTRVLKSLHFAQERQEQADRIAFDMSSRSDLDKVPGVVLDFLFGPWSLAMAHARLADQRNQVDPEGFGSVVPDLLWSVKRDVTLKRPARLIEMIPGLLEKLHTGLAMLGQAPQENEKFFESLMKLHQPVLKLRRQKSRQDAEASGPMPLDGLEPLEDHEVPATPEQRRAKAAEQPWLGREELDAAGFEDTLPTAPGELLAMDIGEPAASGTTADTLAATAAPAAAVDKATPEEATRVLMSLRTGHWVDLYSKHQWLRAQLVWASTKATLFMFLSHGGQPHSMTRRSCEKLIMQRWLRPVDSQAVVAQALDAVTVDAGTRAKARKEADSDFSDLHPQQREAETV
ncbi:MAG: DUF1631 family protein [Pseudomonadota bacterium]